MKYNYVTNYKNDNALRRSFNEMTENTFSFNFVEWFNNGFWGDKYIPHSLVDGEKVIANVSVSLMDFNMDGIDKSYIQIGTVMTDEKYRGQGLSRYLIEKIIEEYKGKVDGIYLFANDSVIDFYPKFAFIRGKEYQYSKMINSINSKIQVEHIDMTNKMARHKFLDTVKNSVGNERLSMSNFGLMAFWTTGPMNDLIYYYADENAYIIADIEKENLYIYQVISICKVNLEKVIKSSGSNIKKVRLGFTPYDVNGYDAVEFYKQNCTFFYLGKDLDKIEKKKLMFPILSHA